MQLVLWMLALTTAHTHAAIADIDTWLAAEKQASVELLLAADSPAGCAPGAVIASPSKVNPNYFFHWVRDASLAMDQVVALYEQARTPAQKQNLFQRLSDFIDFSRKNQQTPNASGAADDLGLGEPHFNCDGTPFTAPWGRPQSDGPALRAITLIRFANDLIREGRTDVVRGKLATVIDFDVDYVARHWRDPAFDLWEEVKGDHFYTRMVQRRALIEGAAFEAALGDASTANVLRSQVPAISGEISKHWDPQRGFIVSTLNVVNGLRGKSGLDSAVVLAALHGCAGDGFFCPNDPKIMATALKLEQTFSAIYPIAQFHANAQGEALGVPIGRYPEDTYSGAEQRTEGNPWFLLTNAFAELYFKSGQADKARGFLRRVRFHEAGNSPSFSEQYNRHTGFMQSAHDLTWNYASFLSIPD
jgi:glucoamylase